MSNSKNIKKLSVVALLSAISAILMFIDFSVPIAPSFMKMDISELPVIIGGFVLSPIECIIIAVLKVLIKTLIKNSSTMFIGELANIIASISYALPASIIYSLHKTKKTALVGLTVGTILSSAMSTITNATFVFPLYLKLSNMTEEAIIKMCSAINPMIDSMFKVMMLSVLPFNLLKYIIVSIITYIFYKSISKILKNILK